MKNENFLIQVPPQHHSRCGFVVNSRALRFVFSTLYQWLIQKTIHSSHSIFYPEKEFFIPLMVFALQRVHAKAGLWCGSLVNRLDRNNKKGLQMHENEFSTALIDSQINGFSFIIERDVERIKMAFETSLGMIFLTKDAQNNILSVPRVELGKRILEIKSLIEQTKDIAGPWCSLLVLPPEFWKLDGAQARCAPDFFSDFWPSTEALWY